MKWAPSKRSTKFSKPICNAIVIPSIEIKYWSKITPIDIKLTTKFKFLNVQHPTYCWPQRISSAYPVPKLKHIIFGIHSEFSHLSLICWKGYEMFGNSTFLSIQKLINNYVWYMYHEIISTHYNKLLFTIFNQLIGNLRPSKFPEATSLLSLRWWLFLE